MAHNQSSSRGLSPFNPVDHLRLLAWCFFAPGRLADFQERWGRAEIQKTGAWLASTLLWLPLLIIMLAVSLGTIPLADRRTPPWLIAAGMVLGWAITGLMSEREHDRSLGWRASFGEVFSVAFIMVFGLAFGIAFGMGLVVGFDLVGIVAFAGMFSPASFVTLVLAFGFAFGVGLVIADQVAFGGIFIVAPVVAFVVAFVGVFGLGFVGVFFATFIVVFGIVFMFAFAFALVSTSILVNQLETNPDGVLSRTFRLSGLAALTLAHAALIWLCFFNGWDILG